MGGWKTKKCADLTPEEWEKKRAYERKRWERWSPERKAQHNAKGKDWYHQNKAYAQELAYNRSLKMRYGMTRDQYDSLLSQQGECCAICQKRQSRRLHVDHNHLTKEVRGLLCHGCNRALAYLEDVIWHVAALQYLAKN